MAKDTAEIIEGDDESDAASFFMELCGLYYLDVFRDPKILIREIWEKNLDKILYIIKERAFNRIDYLVFGYFTLLTGANLPAHVRPAILDAADWKYEEDTWGDPDFILQRKFYLEDFRKKIQDYSPGKSIHLVILKNFAEDLKYGVVGVDQFWEYVLSKKIYAAKHVNLDSCDLEKIPEPIYKIQNLETLSLEHNEIKKISKDIENLRDLKKLYLDGNQISSIPDSFGNLKKLNKLYLHDNKLTNVPHSISNLDSLEVLTLSENPLNDVLRSLSRLKNLRALYLENTLIKTIPEFLKNTKVNIILE